MVPLFGDCKGLVVVIRWGCGVIREVKILICDLERLLRFYLSLSEGLRVFVRVIGKSKSLYLI